jgi:hypothetical protein
MKNTFQTVPSTVRCALFAIPGFLIITYASCYMLVDLLAAWMRSGSSGGASAQRPGKASFPMMK